jgi:hypothetical protein
MRDIECRGAATPNADLCLRALEMYLCIDSVYLGADAEIVVTAALCAPSSYFATRIPCWCYLPQEISLFDEK